MNLSGEQLDMVMEMGALFFAPEDIAINLGLSEEETELFNEGVSCKNSGLPMVEAYLRGWLSSEISLRKAIFQAALNGSNPSQQQLLNFLKENKR